MTLLKIWKSQKWPQKFSTRQKIKKIKKSYQEASNQKGSVNKLGLELKNIKNEIFKNSKKSKMTKKHQKTEN